MAPAGLVTYQVEQDEANHKLINLLDVQLVVKELVSQLPQRALASQNLSNKREGKAQHGSTSLSAQTPVEKHTQLMSTLCIPSQKL
jgi:hypothetical protein